MAQRKKINIDGVSFPFTTEYSIDGGATWTAKAVNEEYIIAYDSITDVDKKVMIRSDSTDATVLTRDNLNLDNITYSSAVIKNGKLIESMESLFSQTFIGDIRISGVPLLKNIKYIAKSTIMRDFHIEPLPNCEDAMEALAYSIGRNVGNISVGDNTDQTIGSRVHGIARDSVYDSFGSITAKNCIDASGPFENSRINVAGHVDVLFASASSPALTALVANGSKFKGDTISMYSGLYYKSDFDVSPSARYIGNTSTDVSIGPEDAKFLEAFMRKNNNATREMYFPSVEVVSLSQADSTDSPLGYSFAGLNQSDTKFGGVAYSAIAKRSSSSNGFHEATHNSSNAIANNIDKMFASIRMLKAPNTYSNYYNEFKSKLEENTFSGKLNLVRSNWFPRHEILYTGKANTNITASTVGYMAKDRTYIKIEKIGSDIKMTGSKRIQPLDECSFDGEVIVIPDSSHLIGNSQGSYCYNNADDSGCVFVSSDGVTTQAISGVTVDDRAMLSADEKWLYKLSSEAIDTAGTTGQQVNQTIKKYSVTDGIIAETITLTNVPDSHARLFYKAFDDYDFKFIIDKYDIVDGAYAVTGSYLISMDELGILSVDDQKLIADGNTIQSIFHHYTETFEFSGFNKTSGIITRMIGK